MTETTQPPAPLRTAHASGLSAVERELAGLHRELLRTGEEGRGVRLSVVTLVVACSDPDSADAASDVVATIASRHPARAILLIADPEAPPGIEADLRLQCSITQGHDQVCAETVRLTIGGEPALHLASVLGPLLLPDVPVQLWLHGAPRPDQALAPEALALVERIILDSDEYADPIGLLRTLAAALERHPGTLPISDLTWARLRPWRELVARAVDAATRRPFLRHVESITVRAATGRGGALSEALLLAGWLADRLDAPETVRLELDPASDVPALLAVRLTARNDDGRLLTVSVDRDGDALQTHVTVDGEPLARRRVPWEPLRLADLVGAALEEQEGDPVYAAAVRAALRLA